MLNATVEIHPDVSSASAVIAKSAHRAGEDAGTIVPSLYAAALESNKSHCRRFIQKVFNEGELGLIGDFMSPDVVNHEVADSFGGSQPRPGQGIKWMVELIYLYRRAFPDLRFTIQDQAAEGDRVVTSLRMRGTQDNALMTIAPSGRKIDIAGIRIDRLRDGRIVESWFHLDALGMLRQLDVLPPLNRRPQQTAPASRESVPGGLPAAGSKPASEPRAVWVS